MRANRRDLNTKPATMTHQHFRTIAASIRSLAYDMRSAVAEHFASDLARTNPRFNRERFLAACLDESN